MMTNFKQYLISEENFNAFQDYLTATNQQFPELLKKLLDSKPTAQGGNANFYRIPNSEFGVRIVRGLNDPSPELTPAEDDFGGENLGQPVAHYGKKIQVLRLQHGTPAGMPFRYNQEGGIGIEAGIATFRNQLSTAAEIPQQEYDRLCKIVLDLNSKGYSIDPSKSGNLLIDSQSGKFNFVDINKSESKNTASDIIAMLMDNYHFSKFLNHDPKMKKFAREIIKKVEIAAQKTGLPIGENSSTLDYSRKLSIFEELQIKSISEPLPSTLSPFQNLNKQGIEKWKKQLTSKTFQYPLNQDKFIHFAPKSLISKIKKENKIRGNYGSTYAISTSFGIYLPKVQFRITKQAGLPAGSTEETLGAILFKTNEMPILAKADEVIWKTNYIDIYDVKEISYRLAISILKHTPYGDMLNWNDSVEYQ